MDCLGAAAAGEWTKKDKGEAEEDNEHLYTGFGVHLRREGGTQADKRALGGIKIIAQGDKGNGMEVCRCAAKASLAQRVRVKRTGGEINTSRR